MARELPKGSSKICQYPFADRDVGLISAITVVDDGKGYRRRFRGGLITQREDEGYEEFSDRSDLEREEMMLALVDESIKTAKSRKPPRTSSERP